MDHHHHHHHHTPRSEPNTVASGEPPLYASQAVVPLAWRAVATLPSALVPHDLSLLRVGMTRPQYARDFMKETAILASSMALMPAYVPQESLWLDVLAEVLEEDDTLKGKACAAFYLAAVHHDSRATPEDLLKGLAAGEGRIAPASMHAFSQIRREIAHAIKAEIESVVLRAVSSLRRITQLCIRYDVATRASVCIGDLMWHLPSHTRGGMRAAIVVFLGHYNRGWVAQFRRELRLHHDDRISRVHALVRCDVSIFAVALKSLNTSKLIQDAGVWRFLDKIGLTEAERYHLGEFALMSLAFLYRRPTLAWRAMGWTCSPKRGALLKQMAADAEGMTPREAANLCLAFCL